MKILVTGSRNWTNRKAIENILGQYPSDTILVHGECPTGADKIADEIATEWGWEIRAYPAEWIVDGKLDRGAGPRRNQEMLDQEKPDIVIAFPMPDSRGTLDCMERATAMNIGIIICEKAGDQDG